MKKDKAAIILALLVFAFAISSIISIESFCSGTSFGFIGIVVSILGLMIAGAISDIYEIKLRA